MLQPFVKYAFVRLCLIVSCLLTLSAPVWAQGIVSGSKDIAATVGFSNIAGDAASDRTSFGGSVGINLSQHFTVLGEYSFLPLGSLSEHDQFVGGAVHFNFGKSDRVVPYAVGSGGYARPNSGSSNYYVGLGGGQASI